MKKKILLFVMSFIVLNAFAQTEKFDIASFTPPAGWQRLDSNGVLIFHDYKTSNNLTSFCQIVLFPSRESAASAARNFREEWNKHVVIPTGSKEKPVTQTEKKPDGWTVVSGSANITQPGISYACILVSVSGFGKVMSVLINTAGKDHLAQIESFMNGFEMDSKASASMNAGDRKTVPAGNFDFTNYSFIAPEGWQTHKTKDYIILSQSKTTDPGCTITILSPQPSSGNLEADAKNIFSQLYPGWQYRFSGEKQYNLSKGYTPQGLEYCMMEAPMSKMNADGSRYDGFEDGGAWVIKAGSQVAVIAVRHTSVLAHIDCENKYETWRRFFNSFTVKNQAANKNDEDASKRIVGVWKLSTNGAASGEYVFAANGNYQLAGGIGTSSTTIDHYYEYIHIKSYTFQGDGSYSINGNQLSFKKRGDKNPESVQFRFEKVNHGGIGWKDRVYMLKTDARLGSRYEVCYEKKSQ